MPPMPDYREPVVTRDGPWYPRLCRTLEEFKLFGLEFDFAWRVALRQQPPHPRDLAVGLDFYHRISRDAYLDATAPDGSPSKLRSLDGTLR